ncbi:MAG: transcriptional regulator MntR [Candidatus Bipolaricaulia bacterium]
MATTSVEDYVERIYQLTKEEGEAWVGEIAKRLQVQPPSVTKMIQRLADQNLVTYRKYRGLVTLTEKGEQLAKAIRRRHKMLTRFLELLGVDDKTAQGDIEGLEHHISSTTLDRITEFVEFAHEHPDWLESFEYHRQRED